MDIQGLEEAMAVAGVGGGTVPAPDGPEDR